MAERHKHLWALLAGAAAGLLNGLLGGGGGMVLVPLLREKCGLDQRRAFATSVAVILPLCALSAGIYLWRSGMDWGAAWPYLAGGLAGGWLAGRCFRRLPMDGLRRAFGLLLLWGGLRSLLR
ncbi:sulfite exporter TauE/SafE family protein [Pseudoflavonifractor phocaeensis]|uniref:TSUP family transporter n=1 Tax=Pseudoflavonifractor phocaeensis TaxID=1870988 RepID=UPI00195B4806|nr:TSUP family transporter [Pseudoflavonifractor phocaeensis]MBM6871714.1 sulfite exporter TauE/SafE family protein [Pseudoflavonifractor phocaeensis]MBM6939663.1 sulfite exporter TauE/SafE family protein [Pseudoflavonifractor phocaeensis]